MLLTAREIFALITSVILSIIIGFLVNWNFNELLSEQAVIAYFLIGGIVAVLVYGFKKRTEKFFSKYEKHLDEPSEKENGNSPLLEEYKQKYNMHVKELFNVVISNTEENTKNYYEAVRKVHDEKKLLLEHFSTLSLIHQEYSNLYVWYRAIVAMYNDLDKHSKEFQLLAGEFVTGVYELEFFDSPSENWIKMKDFESAIGISIPTLMDMVRSKLENSEIVVSDHIQYDFPIIYDDSNKEWRIGYENNRFAGSKSEEKIKRLSNYIKEEGGKIAEHSSSFRGKRRMIRDIMEYGFNEQFNDIYQTIKYGEPKVGACNSCIEWFNGKEKEKLKLILSNIRKNEFLEESQWSREEKF